MLDDFPFLFHQEGPFPSGMARFAGIQYPLRIVVANNDVFL
jgi:hypothetical protein